MFYLLYTNSIGFSLFEVIEFEKIDSFLPQSKVTNDAAVAAAAAVDLSRFKEIVKLVSFESFASTHDAFNTIINVVEGFIPEELKSFLGKHFPISEENTLGVLYEDLAANIGEYLGIKCIHEGVVPGVIIGIRCHFFDLIQGFDGNVGDVTRVGPCRSHSPAEEKFVVNLHSNNNIKHNVDLLNMIEEDINSFSSSLRIWYPYNFPELDEIFKDNYLYARVLQLIAEDPQGLPEEKWEKLEEIVEGLEIAELISNAFRCSTGRRTDWMRNILPKYKESIFVFTNRIIRLTGFCNSITKHLIDEMKFIAPNMSAVLAGDELLGARLTALAGSLIDLAKSSSSRVQIMGAEKVVARRRKRGCNTPKYGMLHSSSFIKRAHGRNKGIIARILANKMIIAARLDCFSNDKTKGESLHKEVENRFLCLEACRDLPPKKNFNFFMEEDQIEEMGDDEYLVDKDDEECNQAKKQKTSEELIGDEDSSQTKEQKTSQE